MALLGFQEWKAKKVESGECRQTIRARRVHPVKVGDRLIFARGVRTKNYRKIGTAVCTQTFAIVMHMSPDGKNATFLTGSPGDPIETIAHLDGFKNQVEMAKWFAENHPIKNGELLFLDVIRW